MPSRPNFPIPEDIHPTMQCIQLCIPNEPTYKSVFAGLIYELTYWFNWQRTDGDEGAQCAAVWKEIYNSIDWSTMSCCCPEKTLPLTRITAEGHYQTSTDGGTTWEDNEQADPRTAQPYYPPFLPDGTTDETCTYADSIVVMIKTQLVDLLEDGASYAQILGVIATVFTTLMAALAPTVIGTLIVGILGAIIVGILQVGVPAFKAAMTGDVYDRFRCNLKNNMGADGSFSQVQVDAVYAQISSDETGLAMLFLQGFVAAASMVGLTNAARAGYGAPDADCPCGACVGVWAVGNIDGATAYGTLISATGSSYIFSGQLAFDGLYYLTIKTPSADQCCSVLSMEATPGHSMPSTGMSANRIICPAAQTGSSVTGGNIDYTVGSLNYIGIQSINAFEVEIIFS